MQITSPGTASPGSTVCLQVTGISGTLRAKATFNGKKVRVVVQQARDGTATVCVDLPAGTRGALDFDLSDDSHQPTAESVIVS